MSLTYQDGAGAGSVEYTLGGGSARTAAASATTTSYYAGGVLYSVILTIQFTDPADGQATAMLIVNPFTGSGAYKSSDPTQTLTMWFSTAVAGNGRWGNDGVDGATVVLDAIYNVLANGDALWSGSVSASGLAWAGTGTQPPLDVQLTSVTLTVAPTT